MATAQPSRPARHRRLLLILPVLLIVAVVANWSDVLKVASGERSLRSIVYGRPDKEGFEISGWEMPKDTGSPDAKVVVEIFCIPGDPCHIATAFLGRALGSLDRERIRVKFCASRPGQPGPHRQDDLKLGCDQGLAINGKTKFSVPDPAKPGRQKVVFTSHKGGGMEPAILYVALDRELKAVYKGKGLGMTEAQFAAQLDAANKRFALLEEAKAKARQEEEQAKKR